MRAAASDSRSTLMTGTAAHRARLEAQEGAVVFGRLQQLGAVLREELLVGRHDRLAGREGGELERARRLDAADQLDHDVDLGVVHEIGELGRRAHAGGTSAGARARVADGAQASPLCRSPGGSRRRSREQPSDARTHGPVAHKADADLDSTGGPFCRMVPQESAPAQLAPAGAAGRRSAHARPV